MLHSKRIFLEGQKRIKKEVIPMIIKIVRVPEGPPPLWVRQAWLKADEMPAERLSSPALEIDPFKIEEAGVKQSDFVNMQHARHLLEKYIPGASKGNRGGFFVTFADGVKALENFSLEAAGWFKQNWPNRSKGFAFGPDEAIVVKE
ncbi:MAG: hypothetical protein NTW06_01565 [Candidatus Falkowbacteria bacterium]|nr:hypothetical protein [Candidatus Falkowbacteria bacterium]